MQSFRNWTTAPPCGRNSSVTLAVYFLTSTNISLLWCHCETKLNCEHRKCAFAYEHGTSCTFVRVCFNYSACITLTLLYKCVQKVTDLSESLIRIYILHSQPPHTVKHRTLNYWRHHCWYWCVILKAWLVSAPPGGVAVTPTLQLSMFTLFEHIFHCQIFPKPAAETLLHTS